MSMTPGSGSLPVAPAAGESSYEFHRLMRRDERYRWWKPLALLGTASGFMLVLSVVVGLFMLVVMMLNPAFWSSDSEAIEVLSLENMADPTTFTLLMLSLIVMIPAAWFAYLLLGPKPTGSLFSVAGRIRWRWLGLALSVSAGAYLLYFGCSFALSALGVGDQAPLPASSIPSSPVFYAILVLLLTPFQCAAEELVFRGVFMQVIGSWLKHPLFAILLPVPLFTIGHDYELMGLIDVTVFAIAAGYLTWRTGGLEAAIAVHVINNTFIFLLGAMGQVDLNDDGSDLVGLLTSVVLTAVLTFVLVKLATKKGIERTAGPTPPRQRPELLHPWPVSYPVNQAPAYWAPPEAGMVPPTNIGQPVQSQVVPPPAEDPRCTDV